jgi:carbonic anhydrase/acetyltransferase-like protein (isoleucine patch superfamily)
MALYALGELRPDIDPSAWVHESAQVIGDVTLAEGVTVWPGAVLRGDFGSITIGPNSVIEDNCVLHAGSRPTRIGAEVVVGHLVHMEGCEVGDAVLIGSGSVVLRGVVVESGAVVAAGALVPQGMRVPTGQRAQGVPARLVEAKSMAAAVREGASTYRANGERWRRDLVRLEEPA